MYWHAEVEFVVELAQEQLDRVTAALAATEDDGRGFRAAFYNSADLVLRLRAGIGDSEYTQAVEGARAWVADVAMPAVNRAAAGAVVQRLLVESAEAHMARWASGTKEAAELLGISPTRLRQIEGSDGFPEPVAELAGGSVFRRDEVETYGRRRVRGKGGRPRKEAPEA